MRQDEEDTDEHKDWQPVPGVYALGDCCADLCRPLPPLAQARGREGGRRGAPAPRLAGARARGISTCTVHLTRRLLAC